MADATAKTRTPASPMIPVVLEVWVVWLVRVVPASPAASAPAASQRATRHQGPPCPATWHSALNEEGCASFPAVDIPRGRPAICEPHTPPLYLLCLDA